MVKQARSDSFGHSIIGLISCQQKVSWVDGGQGLVDAKLFELLVLWFLIGMDAEQVIEKHGFSYLTSDINGLYDSFLAWISLLRPYLLLELNKKVRLDHFWGSDPHLHLMSLLRAQCTGNNNRIEITTWLTVPHEYPITGWRISRNSGLEDKLKPLLSYLPLTTPPKCLKSKLWLQQMLEKSP